MQKRALGPRLGAKPIRSVSPKVPVGNVARDGRVARSVSPNPARRVVGDTKTFRVVAGTVPLRNTMNVNDRDLGIAGPIRGCIVAAVRVGDKWLRLNSGHYLPFMVDSLPAFEPATDPKPNDRIWRLENAQQGKAVVPTHEATQRATPSPAPTLRLAAVPKQSAQNTPRLRRRASKSPSVIEKERKVSSSHAVPQRRRRASAVLQEKEKEKDDTQPRYSAVAIAAAAKTKERGESAVKKRSDVKPGRGVSMEQRAPSPSELLTKLKEKERAGEARAELRYRMPSRSASGERDPPADYHILRHEVRTITPRHSSARSAVSTARTSQSPLRSFDIPPPPTSTHEIRRLHRDDDELGMTLPQTARVSPLRSPRSGSGGSGVQTTTTSSQFPSPAARTPKARTPKGNQFLRTLSMVMPEKPITSRFVMPSVESSSESDGLTNSEPADVNAVKEQLHRALLSLERGDAAAHTVQEIREALHSARQLSTTTPPSASSVSPTCTSSSPTSDDASLRTLSRPAPEERDDLLCQLSDMLEERKRRRDGRMREGDVLLLSDLQAAPSQGKDDAVLLQLSEMLEERRGRGYGRVVSQLRREEQARKTAELRLEELRRECRGKVLDRRLALEVTTTTTPVDTEHDATSNSPCPKACTQIPYPHPMGETATRYVWDEQRYCVGRAVQTTQEIDLGGTKLCTGEVGVVSVSAHGTNAPQIKIRDLLFIPEGGQIKSYKNHIPKRSAQAWHSPSRASTPPTTQTRPEEECEADAGGIPPAEAPAPEKSPNKAGDSEGMRDLVWHLNGRVFFLRS